MREGLNLMWREVRLEAERSLRIVPHAGLDLTAKRIRQDFQLSETRDLIVNQLTGLADMQFNPEKVWGELAGRVGIAEPVINFEPIPSKQDEMLIECLEDFRDRRNFDAGIILVSCVAQYREILEFNDSDFDGTHLRNLEESLKKFTREARPRSSDVFPYMAYLETILKSATGIKLCDLRPDESDFAGAFHFHPNSSPANLGDFEQCKVLKVPMVIVSVQPEHPKVTEVSLIADKEFDVLYSI